MNDKIQQCVTVHVSGECEGCPDNERCNGETEVGL